MARNISAGLKVFVTLYLLIGIVFVGLDIGEKLRMCPEAWNQKVTSDLLVSVVIWPSMTIAVMYAGDSFPQNVRPLCEAGGQL